MASDLNVEGLQRQNLTPEVDIHERTANDGESKYLLFNPPDHAKWLRDQFEKIPRYLFRISTPVSDGTTDMIWAKSKDARYNRDNKDKDTLSKEDRRKEAIAFYKHIRWWGKIEEMDNFLSWTSSLLYAIQYIFYRLHGEGKKLTIEQIELYVIDTQCFPKGVFLRDADLGKHYGSEDPRIKDFMTIRDEESKNVMNFGEYLSQGALKIEGNCQMISAKDLITPHLFQLRPEFEDSYLKNIRTWAKKVMELRELFHKGDPTAQETTKKDVEAAVALASLFGPRWRLPLAVNLLSMKPRRKNDETILEAFNSQPFTDEERRQCSPELTKVVVFDSMPEVKQFANIMRDIYVDSAFPCAII